MAFCVFKNRQKKKIIHDSKNLFINRYAKRDVWISGNCNDEFNIELDMTGLSYDLS